MEVIRIAKFVAYAALATGSLIMSGAAGQSETVDEVIIEQYIGGWTQLYGNNVSNQIATSGLTCVGGIYGLDEPSGNITMTHFGRVNSPTGDLETITGYAYATDENEPGQLKLVYPSVPADGDYWIVGLGPATFGPDGLYEWAIVSNFAAEQLFILVRDVEDFEIFFEASVLAFVTEDLGFTGPEKAPQRIIQEGCLAIALPAEEDADDSAADPGQERRALNKAVDGSRIGRYIEQDTLEGGEGSESDSGEDSEDQDEQALIEAVDELDVNKYIGNWTTLYSNSFSEENAISGLVCVGASYGLDEPSGNITVLNFGREGSPDGEPSSISGYAYGVDDNEPGQLKVSLAFVPRDGDYWVVGLGPATFGHEGLYEWAIVSGPTAEQLFILVRDVEDFEAYFEASVLTSVTEDLGFTGPEKEPRRIVQEGCPPRPA